MKKIRGLLVLTMFAALTLSPQQETSAPSSSEPAVQYSAPLPEGETPSGEEMPQTQAAAPEKWYTSLFSLEKLPTHFNETSSLFLSLLFAFLLGVLISFTPCIYPLIPVTVSILQAQKAPTLLRGFLSALWYVLGMATVYSILGYVVATSGRVFGAWLGNPFFIGVIIAFLLYLAFSLFGFYELYIPRFLQRPTQIKHPSFFYNFFAGMLAGTIASPCATPGLAIILAFVAKQAQPLYGFLTLFSFSLGMGILLILIGTFSSLLDFLPSSGSWMVEAKRALGFIMLFMCIYFLEPLIPNSIITTLLKLGIIAAAALYYFISGFLDFQNEKMEDLIIPRHGIYKILRSSFIKWFIGIMLVLGIILLALIIILIPEIS